MKYACVNEKTFFDRVRSAFLKKKAVPRVVKLRFIVWRVEVEFS